MKKSIISYLIKKGFTSSQAAEKLGVSRKLVTRWAKRNELRFPYRKGTPGILDKSTVKTLLKRGYRNSDIDDIFKVGKGTTTTFRSRNGLEYSSGIPYYRKSIKQNDFSKSVLIGTVLGDSSINKNGYVYCIHSLKQKRYCKWKADVLGAKFTINKPRKDKRTLKYYESCSFYLPNSKYSKFLRQELYSPTKQLTPKSLLHYNAISLAVHFMDDGTKTNSSYRIATNSFTKDSLRIFNNHCIKTFGIYFTVHNENKLYLPKKFRAIFEQLIKPYIHPELEYKLHDL